MSRPGRPARDRRQRQGGDDGAEPADFTIVTVPPRFAELGDLHAGIDDAVFAIDELLEWAARDALAGSPDVPEPDEPAG